MGIKSTIQMKRDYEAEVASWKEFAAQQLRNTEYYQGLLDEIGIFIGEEAYRTEENEVATEIIRAKLPELVEKLIRNTNKKG